MPESLRTTIGQFSSSGGRRQARAINVRAVEPAPDLPSARRGSLYLLVEVGGSGGGHGALYRQMLNAAQGAFYEMGETVEAALRQAVRNVHAVLRRANEGLPEANWRAGISMVVRYGDQLIIGQAGPGLVLVSHARTIDQFPADLGSQRVPLGGDARPEVAIFDATVESGSMVLLAQSEWAQQVSMEALAVAAAAPSVALASQYLGQLAGTAELSALLIGFSSEIPEVREEAGPMLAGRQAVPPSTTEGDAAVGRGAAPDAARGRGRGRPAAERQGSPQDATVSPVPAQAAARTATAAASGPATEASELAPPPAIIPAEGPEAEAARPPPPAQAAEGRPRRRSPWPMVVALLIIPLLIVIVVLAMLFFRARAAEAQFRQMLDGAASVLSDVETLADETAARQRLGSARDFLDKARAVHPDDPRLADLENRYEASLERVEHVTILYGIVPLWDFKEAGHTLERVVIGGDSLFVLDRGRNEVYRLIRSQLGDNVTPADKPVLRKGDPVGDQVVSDLLDMAWAEAAGANPRSRLLVLDTAGGLVGYDTTWALSRLAIGSRDRWGAPQLIAGYGGNLYVVDPGVNQIWRYRPAASGYEGAAETYFASDAPADLSGVQAVAIDGSVWLLYADGRLIRFFGGQQRPFEFQNVPGKLSAPTSVTAPLEGDRVYVADAGNGRIIETTKDGRFLRQFRAREGEILRDVRCVVLDDANALFYILTSDRLYAANIPAAATTPTPASGGGG